MPRSSWSLAFRLTAWQTAASLLLLMASSGILYWALVSNLDRDSTLFLADKVHVITTLLRERPNDWDGLKEEVQLESAARRYNQFYIRLLDPHGKYSSGDAANESRFTRCQLRKGYRKAQRKFNLLSHRSTRQRKLWRQLVGPKAFIGKSRLRSAWRNSSKCWLAIGSGFGPFCQHPLSCVPWWDTRLQDEASDPFAM